MFTAKDALFLILLPFLLAAGAGAATFFTRRTRFPAWPLIIGLTIAPLAGALFNFQLSSPMEALDWLILLPAIILVAGVLTEFLPAWVAIILLPLAGYNSVYLLAKLLPAGTVPTPVYWLIALAPVILFLILLRPATKRSAPAAPALFLLLATATVIVELAGSFIKFGQYTVALPAALGAIFLTQLLLRPGASSKGLLAAFLLLWTAALAFGYLWADVPALRTLLLAAAPLTLWLAEIPKTLSPTKRTALALILAAIPLAFAVYPAAKELLVLLHSQTQVEQY